jgi:NADPH:quinone reductase
VDGLWGEPFARALEAAADGVRVVQLGQSAGPAATLESGSVRGKGAEILGHSLVAHVPEDVAASGYRVLAEHIRDGEITVGTEAYPLEDVAEAWHRQASGSPGAKIVVRV